MLWVFGGNIVCVSIIVWIFLIFEKAMPSGDTPPRPGVQREEVLYLCRLFVLQSSVHHIEVEVKSAILSCSVSSLGWLVSRITHTL